MSDISKDIQSSQKVGKAKVKINKVSVIVDIGEDVSSFEEAKQIFKEQWKDFGEWEFWDGGMGVTEQDDGEGLKGK